MALPGAARGIRYPARQRRPRTPARWRRRRGADSLSGTDDPGDPRGSPAWAAVRERWGRGGLEGEVGGEVLGGDGKGVRVAWAGGRILAYAEHVVDMVGTLRAALQGDSLPVGHLRIGAMDTVVHTWLVDLIAELSHSYP